MTQNTADALSDAGFRTPDGEMLRKRGSRGPHVVGEDDPARSCRQSADVDELLNEWAGVNLSGRVQVLLDVSGLDERAGAWHRREPHGA